MIDKVRTITRTRFRKTNFNAFLFFLLLAVIIWIFSQFSKVYNEVIEIPVKYINAPLDKYITEDNPEKLMLQMEATGFSLSYYSLFPPTLHIDVSKARVEDGEILYVIDEHREEIQSQLGISFEQSHFVNGVIAIQYQQRKEKVVPVYPRVNVEYAVGYAAAEKLRVTPDSITVSGPDNILDTLNQLQTVVLNLKDVNRDMQGTVAIDTTHLSKVTLYKGKVNFELKVEKFTEGRVEIPIDLINVPEGLNVVIFPKNILLFYQVNLKDFSSIIPSDFRVVCDFNELEGDQDFLIPKIVNKPEMVTNVRLNEKKIQFIIRK